MKEILEKDVQAELDLLKDIIVQTVPVEQILLFGSYAYGTPRNGFDLDLYVVLKDDAPMRELDAGLQIRTAIRDKKKMPVDIIVKKREEYLQRKQNPTIERKIAREGICIYG